MRVGLHALGIGAGARPEVIRAVAMAAEAAGFATLWAGEHVVLVDQPRSRYPYSDDGRIAVPASADWLDPLLTLSFAAAVTTTIGLATGVLLLPEHNPVVSAKQAATLDVLSGGRLTLGVGIGWSAEEFDALGIPFTGRARRTAEYVAAIRTLWADDVASFSGEFTRFESVRVNPKPVRGRRIPVVVGGNSDGALARVAAFADGWYGFNLPAAAVPERVAALAGQCEQRDRNLRDLSVAVALADGNPGTLPELAGIGVTELVVAETPPAEPAAAVSWVRDLAAQWDVIPRLQLPDAPTAGHAALPPGEKTRCEWPGIGCLVDRPPFTGGNMTRMPLPALTLHTARLRLRPFGDADADALFALHSNARVMRYWDAPPWSERVRSERFITACRQMAQEGTGTRLAVDRVCDGAFIGWCSLNRWNPDYRSASLGYCYGDAAWGHGYATEAAGVLLRWAFGTLDLNRVQAETDTRNVASARVLEKLGFVREGTLREDCIVNGEVSDSWVYGLIRREWPPSSQPVPA